MKRLIIILSPEILFILSVLIITIGMWTLMGWQYGLIFLGLSGLIASSYVMNVVGKEATKN